MKFKNIVMLGLISFIFVSYGQASDNKLSSSESKVERTNKKNKMYKRKTQREQAHKRLQEHTPNPTDHGSDRIK
jgi:hypothetical protein